MTFIDGNEYTKDYREVKLYSKIYTDTMLEKLIDDYENVIRDTEKRLNCRTDKPMSKTDNLVFTIFKDNLSLHQLFTHTKKKQILSIQNGIRYTDK